MDEKPIIFLDRDGVINYDSEHYIKSLDELKFIPGSLEAIARLTKAGHQIFVITNQSGVGRGLFTLETLQQMHQHIAKEAEKLGGKIEKFYFCPHKPEEGCDCRKPKPGMLEKAKQEFQLAEKKLIMVGDSLKDLEAGAAAGAKTFLVKTGNGLKTLAKEIPLPGLIAENLADVADMLLFEDS
jgi:D-glycero-D-manno-heptose 1,7-bisphosphate phosphatase